VLHAIRPEVHFVEATFPDSLARVTADDAIVAFLFRRYSRLTVALVERARDLGAAIVLLSDGGGQRFAGADDRILVAATESTTLYPSMVGAVFLLEALVAATAVVDAERTQQTLEERERFNSEQNLLLGLMPDGDAEAP
jgi:DNA-binding MurR/RpiR family transcriptional regulator